ncbi:MAG: hypothetical protein U0531_17785 [Dehalococcoidia bacterium]
MAAVVVVGTVLLASRRGGPAPPTPEPQIVRTVAPNPTPSPVATSARIAGRHASANPAPLVLLAPGERRLISDGERRRPWSCSDCTGGALRR